ncbi:TGF beta receptor associated protein 1 [Hirsutella rhossiliensis]|uniref:TGF beta receptor associated protein 1 n=1 Tax=Hirsutella rhossiliensis TaxID=111463 RepID=A0A9P8N0K2_9HYPO|nr:TGF beta receptor associated protein 1 [Hirsutella rhossiliensis]KAH0964402.1 TGF beta receptor associated protein 1 [Hirsutella rhossiliensis]
MSTTLDRAHGPSSASTNRAPLEDGPYVLRSLLDNVPLAADGSQDPVGINCVEYLDGNLYVGTSASELLHFVQIPPDPADTSRKPVFILASRLEPAFSAPTGAATSPPQPGVQQILLLPRVGKACVLCNWTVTFYSLPELSPVSATGQVKNCNWIGGTDFNETSETATDVTILLSLKRRIQVVRVGESARAFKNIDYAGSTLSIRRDSIACVADTKSYALLDIERQLKIPLMSISSLDEPPPPGEVGQIQSIAADAGGGIIRSASSAENRPHAVAQSHSRSTSLGGAILGNIRPSPPTPSTSPRPPPPAPESSTTAPSADKPLPAAPSEAPAANQVPEPQAGQQPVSLKPHIASPSPEEFLVVIGTSPSEPGIGMFVNLDGDATRATIEFEEVPDDDDGYVLASMARKSSDKVHYGLEIQRWSAGNESIPEKHWLAAEDVETPSPYGIRSLVGPIEASTPSIRSQDSRTAASLERLSKEKDLFERDDSPDDDSLPEGWEATRNAEGEEFARRLAKTDARLAVWAGDRIWWAARNPLILQLDTALDAACPNGVAIVKDMDKQSIYSALKAIRGREARTELQFLTFGYLRQKAGLLLLVELLTSGTEQLFEGELKALEEVLIESKLDARVVLSLVPGLRNEIIEGRRGIWIYGGVRKVADAFLRSTAFDGLLKAGLGSLGSRAMHFLRRFLSSWRRMKGFASVADESEVFRTVDAALLTVLLELDRHAPKGLGKGGAVRSELNDLVDRGVDCFERAVDLLESYHRLFVLSRLYQSRKMAGDVLATWKRIIEGERDEGQELRDGEQRVREYLAKISSQALVQEYGVWLANRNPRLGVQVFAEDKSRTSTFEPARVVELLREEAPDAVKYYLEYLVFGKGNTAYVNELVAYYLDVVLDELESSAASREAVMAAYDAYRALHAPKPTYHHFLTANAPEGDETWRSRLRLLQLLGGPHDYDSAAIRARIARLSGELLVPETIILAGREQHHDDALRLLVHNLGDYDTAVSYCLRGGTSVYVPPEGRRHGASVPEIEQQRRLFRVVLHEFLAIADPSDRVEQTGALLEHFGGWFDADEVLGLVPDSWPVDVVAGFLVGALKRLVRDKHESIMTRALSGAENVRINYDLVVGIEEKGPSIEAAS